MAEAPGDENTSDGCGQKISFSEDFGWNDTRNPRIAQLIRFAAEEAARTFGVGRAVADLDGRIVHSDELVHRFLGPDEQQSILGPVLGAALGGARVIKHVNSPVLRDRALKIRGAPVRSHDDGEIRGSLAIVEDNNAEKISEMAQRELIANVCHELKTPIGAMGLLADALASETDPDLARGLAERLGEEAVRTGRVVDELLGLGVGDSGRPAICDSYAACSDAVERLDSAARARGIRLCLRGGHGLVRCTPVDLTSAVHHLIENALRYSETGSVVDIDVHNETDWTEISVSDDGIGIRPEHLGPIFERFYRIDAGSSDPAAINSTGGTGLGLAIVKQGVERNGGCVRAESVFGQGSKFTVRLDRGQV